MTQTMMNSTSNADREDLKQKFFQGMSLAAATVNVITTDGAFGRAGVTVSAMSSVSADTQFPTLLVCINESSSSAQTILDNGAFCVNVLRDHQSYVSDAFAGRYKEQLSDKFDCANWSIGELGVPCLDDGLVAFECKLSDVKKVGTHFVCFGEVRKIHVGRQGAALVYANRSYSVPSKIDGAVLQSPDQASVQPTVNLGCFHTFAPFLFPRLARELDDNNSGDVFLIEGDARRMREALFSGEVDLALTYYKNDEAAVDVTPLCDVEPYVLLSENDPLAEKQTLSIQDLDNRDMISVMEDESRNMLEGALLLAGIRPRVKFRARSLEIVRGMVGQGLGFALLMTKPASQLSYDGMPLITRPLADKLSLGRIGLIHRREKLEPPVQKVKSAIMALFA